MVKVSDTNLEQAHEEPARTQYQEGLTGLYCHHDGVPGRFSAFVWVSVDWSVVFGHFMGFAKKQAEVHMTKIHDVNPGMSPIGVGSRLRGVVDRLGSRVMTVDIDLQERLADNEIPSYGHRVYTVRDLPSPVQEVPATRQLIAHDLASAQTVDIWRGRGNVVFQDGSNEDLGGLEPIEIVDVVLLQTGLDDDWGCNAPHRLRSRRSVDQ